MRFPFSHSLGYSDDTAIVASDGPRLRTMHVTVKRFSDWHCMVLNAGKTESFAIHVSQEDREYLSHPDFTVGDIQLEFPSQHTWRYLGLQYTTDLDWSQHLDMLETSFINNTAAKIRRGGFTVSQIQHIYREKIISRVGYTAQFFLIPSAYLSPMGQNHLPCDHTHFS